MKMKHPKLQIRDWWRAPRVVWNLLLRPHDIPRYLRQSLPSHSTPLKLGLPWWSFSAVDVVGEFVNQEMEVFEFGSGGSTIFLARRTGRVTCVEDSKFWSNLVSEEAREQGLRNIEVLVRTYDFRSARNFRDSTYLAALGDRRYDVIVVDGQEESVQVRPDCFWKAEANIKPGGLIVLDDSWRYPQVKAKNNAKSWRDYRGVGCCRRGVTSTCLFFY